MLIKGNGEPWSIPQLLTVCAGGYLYKFTIAILMTPVIYLVHNLIEWYLGSELAAELKARAERAKPDARSHKHWQRLLRKVG